MKKIYFSVICLLLTFVFVFSLQKNNVVFASTPEVKTNDKASLIMEYNSGEIVFENNGDLKLQIASIVKLMTSLLTIEEIERGTIKLTDMVTTTENAAGMGGSQVFIDPFENYTIDQMLRSVIIGSANDAAVALSEHIAGNEDAFVLKMNKRAKELGMNNTVYANSTGLPAAEQYSTAKDVAIILKEIISHPIYQSYSSIWMEDFVHPSGRKTELVNTNKLTRYFKGCDAGKTGFTDEAGYCLVASAKRGDLRFIALSLGAKDSKTRFANVTTLLNYAFANFENKHILDKSVKLAELEIRLGKQKVAQIFAKDDYFALIKKGEKSEYETQLELPNSIKAPLKNQSSVGRAIIIKQGKVIGEVELVVSEEIEKLTYKDAFKDVVSHWN